jgi:hypothetical protein
MLIPLFGLKSERISPSGKTIYKDFIICLLTDSILWVIIVYVNKQIYCP